MRSRRGSLCLLVACSSSIPSSLPAQEVVHLERSWTKRFDGGTSFDMGSSVRTGPDGAVYVSGFTDLHGTFDLHTLCYSSDGDVLWEAVYDSGGDDTEAVLAVDPTGGLTVAAQASSDTGWRFVVLKYDPDGALLWDTFLDGGEQPAAGFTRHQFQVLADPTSETVYLATVLDSVPSVAAMDVTGEALWSRAIPHAEDGESVHAAFDPEGNLFAASGGGVVKLRPDGGTLWAVPIELDGFETRQAWSIALDTRIGAVITGYAQGGGGGGRHPFAARLDLDGRIAWVRRLELPEHPGGAGWQALVDARGDILLGMSADGVAGEDIGVLKLDREGQRLWSASYDGPVHGADQHAEMALDAGGRLFVAGMTTTACDDPVCSSFTTDYVLLVYGPEGSLLAQDRFDGEDDAGSDAPDWPNSLALGADGFAHVTGFSWSDAGFYDFLTIQYELAAGSLTSPFRRADVDGDGTVRLTDAIAILLHLFQGEAEPACSKAADADDSGVLDLTDPVFLLNHLFVGASPPPAPAETCGADPTQDGLACEAGGSCGG